MPTIRTTSLGFLLSLTGLLAGACGDGDGGGDTAEAAAAEMEIALRIAVPLPALADREADAASAELDRAYVTGIFRPALQPLPARDDVSLSVDGHAIDHRTDSSGPSRAFILSGRVEPVAAGDTFDFTLAWADGETVTSSIAMVSSTRIVAPSGPVSLRTGDGLRVAWSNAEAGTTDWLSLRFASFGRISLPPEHGHSLRAPSGASEVTLDPAWLSRWYEDALGSADAEEAGVEDGDAIEAELVVSRVRTVTGADGLGLGDILLVAELAAVPVTVIP